MMFKVWAYIMASLCSIIAIFSLNKNQWKFNKWIGWIICLSLAVFIGGSINIAEISAFNNSFNKMRNDVNNLKDRFTQLINIKQEISQNVQVVTEIKKEIANLQETMYQYFNKIQTENFRKVDIDRRIKILPMPKDPNSSFILFELGAVPLKNSIELSNRMGVRSPTTFEKFLDNIVIYRVNAPPDNIFKEDKAFFAIKYFPDSSSQGQLKTLEGMAYKVINDEIEFDFKPKSENIIPN